MNRIVLFLLTAFLIGGAQVGHSQTTFTISGGVTMTVNGGTNMNILGNVVFQPSGAIDNSGTISLTGDWTNNSGATGLINSSPGMVNFYGDTQTIGGSDLTRFYDLDLSGTGLKMLAVHSEAEGVLDLNDRELRTDTFDMFVSNSNDTAIQRTSGYVSSSGNGRLSRNTASTNTYLFPVGDPANGGTYRPIELTPSNGASNTFDVRFVNNDPTNDGYNRANRDSSFCTVNDGFYHFIEQSAGTSASDIRMYYDTATDGSFTQIGGWLNVPQWQNTSTATTGQANGQDYVDVAAWNDYSFGVFALGRGVEKPQIVASGPLTFCAPGSITLTTSISYDTIVWSTGSTADTISVNSTSDVFAVVSDANGCSAISDTVNIVVQPLPSAGFNSSTAGFTANFTNISLNGTTYSWDFGDGNSSTATNPSHTYSANGTYTVCLIATNSCGNDTTCKPVVINCPTPTTNFTYLTNNLQVSFTDNSTGGATSYTWDFGDGNAGSGANASHTYNLPGTYTVCLVTQNNCGFDTACQNVTVTCPAPVAGYTFNSNNLAVSFNNISTGGATSYSWDFGDGNGTSNPNPSHTFTTPGTYQVCLIASSVCGSDTSCQNVTVTCPVPNGSFGFNANNLSISFTNATTGASSYSWDFGDGNASTGATPTHNYAAPGTYTVCLISTNSCGNDTTCQNITVTCPVPNGGFTFNTTNLSVGFTNTTSNASSYSWDFGDGNSSTMTSPSHTYSSPGSYTVCLISTNSCGNDTICQTVNVQCPLPTSGFGFNANNLAVSFSNSSVNASGYAWDFGDGNTSNQTTPTHNYSTPGTYTVCLIAQNNCGNDTFCQNINVVCPVPTGAFGFNNNGLIATFTNNSTNANSYSWDFGDGSVSTIPNPSHTYNSPGTYTVCMIATNSCGNDTICQSVTVSCTLPVSAYTYSTSNQTVNFTDQSTNGPTSWFWDFGDGNTSNLQNVSYTFAQPGTYNVCLITTNNCGSDTACQNVTVTCPQPSANFNFSPANLTVSFNDLSVSGITNWNWDFGDGNTSTLQNPSHSYAAAGTYQVCLIAANACGSDTICRSVTVTCVNPVAGFTNSISNLTVTFSDISAYTPTSWFWEFGDGNTSTQQNPVHVYANAGSYQVCLKVDNDCGSDKTCRVINIETTGINDLTEQVKMEVYPNPASNFVEVHADASNQKVRSVTMMDALGKTIKVEHISNAKEVDLRWKVSDLAAGVYLIQVQFEDGVATKRLVVSH